MGTFFVVLGFVAGTITVIGLIMCAFIALAEAHYILGAGLVVLTVVLIAILLTLVVDGLRQEQCPAGTTLEYHATGDRTGYHYCLATSPR
jgi:ABC-type uncharacterized transport system permease subunit